MRRVMTRWPPIFTVLLIFGCRGTSDASSSKSPLPQVEQPIAWEEDEIANFIQRKLGGDFRVQIVSRKLFSTGMIGTAPARIDKVKYTLTTSNSWTAVEKVCSYILYTQNVEWKTTEHIIISAEGQETHSEGECSSDPTSYGGGSFHLRVVAEGYTGKFP